MISQPASRPALNFPNLSPSAHTFSTSNSHKKEQFFFKRFSIFLMLYSLLFSLHLHFLSFLLAPARHKHLEYRPAFSTTYRAPLIPTPPSRLVSFIPFLFVQTSYTIRGTVHTVNCSTTRRRDRVILDLVCLQSEHNTTSRSTAKLRQYNVRVHDDV